MRKDFGTLPRSGEHYHQKQRLATSRSMAKEANKRVDAAYEHCAQIAERIGRELGEPAIGGAIANAIRKEE